MPKVNKTQCAVLGMLAIAPMSGYEIRQTMQQSTDNFWSESDGQLYPALAALNKQGLISCKATGSSGVREKKIYRITAKGTLELKNWLARKADKQSIRNEFMLKLFFGANTAPEINIDHVQAQRYQAKTALMRLIETKKELEEKHKDSSHLPYWLMSVDYGIKITKVKLAWCDDVINKLETLKLKR